MMLSGALVAAGVLIIGVTWFALRGGEPWALALLAIAGVVVLPFWVLVLRPYVLVHAPLGIGDIPPFMLCLR